MTTGQLIGGGATQLRATLTDFHPTRPWTQDDLTEIKNGADFDVLCRVIYANYIDELYAGFCSASCTIDVEDAEQIQDVRSVAVFSRSGNDDTLLALVPLTIDDLPQIAQGSYYITFELEGWDAIPTS